MATTKKMDHDMAYFRGREPPKMTRKMMEGDDRENGWQGRKRWMATMEKMEQDMAFFGGRMPSTITRKKMDGNDKEDGIRQGIFWVKSAINGDKKEDGW